MDSNFTNENDPWEYSLDIDDSDLHLTHVLRSSSSAHVEPSPYTPNPVTIIPGPAGVVQLSNSICVEPSSSTPNPVRIIPGPAGLVQRAKLLKENVFILDPDGALMSTQEYMQKVVEDVGEDADFNSGAWVSATNYVNAFGGTVTGCLGDIDNFLKKGKLEQVVAIVKSCSPNALGDLNVTLKDLSGTVPGTIHYKVLDVGSYEKDITVGAAMILANVSVFTPKPSKHYLNITKRNVVEVFPFFDSGNSAGTVTAYYLSSTRAKHDEIDFEFLETQQENLTRWYVDSIPIRVFRNYQSEGIAYPNQQGMRVYSSLWNAHNWATRGGLVKIDWTAAPFVAYYHRFRARACKWNGPVSISQCAIPSKANWWTSNVYKQLTMSQQGQLKWVQDNQMIYNYCTR
ncbi:hypothetical protein Tco_0201250 [Tanacetum coccineum]